MLNAITPPYPSSPARAAAQSLARAIVQMRDGVAAARASSRPAPWAALLLLSAVVLLFPANAARAQSSEGVLIDTFTPDGFVAPNAADVRRTPSAWQPLGVRVSSFQVNAQVGLTNGVTTNTYQTTSDPQASAFYRLAPRVDVKSDWSRHSLVLHGDAQLDHYVGETRRNEDRWNLSADGRVDVSTALKVRYQVSSSLQTRNRFSGDILSTDAPISTFRQDAIALNVNYTSGRGRLSFDAQVFDFRFQPLDLIDGSKMDQSQLDRRVGRVAGQFQYALSPVIGLYVQADANQIDFDRTVLRTVQDSDSSGGRVIAGAEITIAGYVSATVGLGYSIRTYAEPGIASVKGLSGEAQVELYLSKLTMFTLQAGRRISNTGFVATDPYKQTMATARLDHALLTNLLVSANAQYSVLDYIGRPQKSSTVQSGLNARYLASRRFELDGGVVYSQLSRETRQSVPNVDEIRAQVRVTFKL